MAHATNFTVEDVQEIIEAEPLKIPSWFRLTLVILVKFNIF